MHPGFFGWWKHAHGAAGPQGVGVCDARGGCGPAAWHGAPAAMGWHAASDDGEAGFGVRRPLRFLAYKLELEPAQVESLAAILNELKTERAQAAVDQRRTSSAYADAMADGVFDPEKARAAKEERVRATERREASVAVALAKIHAVLNDEQRKRFAYLVRTGALTI
jgi:Spy/CpxP family protein refolding chaperone